MKFYYTYILQTQKSPDRFYIGFTENLESRLKSHNRGDNPHTSKYKPWRIKKALDYYRSRLLLQNIAENRDCNSWQD
jgi:predicted GIY-YIG superfamily endonuclease